MNIRAQSKTIWISTDKYFFVVELLIEFDSNLAIINVSWKEPLLVIKILIDSSVIFISNIIRQLLMPTIRNIDHPLYIFADDDCN